MGSGGVNKVILIGNLGKDPEVRFTGESGQAVANFTVATSDTWTDKNGQKQERTEWHRIVVWGKLAELCGEHLKKGRQCYIEGRLQTREWTDKENRKNYTTEVVAQVVTFLGGKGGESEQGQERTREQPRGGASRSGGRDQGRGQQPRGGGRGQRPSHEAAPNQEDYGANETGGGGQGGGGDDDIPF